MGSRLEAVGIMFIGVVLIIIAAEIHLGGALVYWLGPLEAAQYTYLAVVPALVGVVLIILGAINYAKAKQPPP